MTPTTDTPTGGTPTDLRADVDTGPPTGVPTGGASGPATPTPATPIRVSAEELAGVAWNADGLVPAIVQEQGTGQVLMLAWMNEESLRRTLAEGRTVFWSRSRQRAVAQGGHVRRPPVGPRGLLRLRRRHAAVRRRPGGRGRLPHRRAQLLLPGLRLLRRTRASLSAGAGPTRPSRDEFLALARDHTVVPVWREVLADLETPVSAFVKLVGDRRPASSSSRSSTPSGGAGSRSSAATPRDDGRARAVASSSTAPPRPASRLDRRRARRARGAPGAPTGRRASPSCRRSTAASSATSATTWCARSSTCPTSRPTTSACPTRCSPSSGSVAAFDHFRQRLYLIENVFLDRLASTARRRRLRRAPSPASTAASTSSPARCRTRRRRRPPTSSTELPDVPLDDGRRAVRRPRSRRPRSTSSPATSSRSCSPSASTSIEPVDPFDVYRVLRQVNPRPYMYFLRHPEVDARRLVARADGAAARRPGHQPADRRDTPARSHRRGRPADGRRAHRAPEGAGRARDARRPRPQRRRPGRRRSAPSRSTS